MTDDRRTDIMRRHVAAIHITMSGPTFDRFLDTKHVLVGAGSGIPEAHRPQYAYELPRQRRCMIYFEFALGADVTRPTRMHVVEPHGTGVAWYDDCVLWTGEGFSEIQIVPIAPGSDVRYLSRGGGLRIAQGRPSDLEAGIQRAEARFAHTVQALGPMDIAGQNRVEEDGGTDSWWQHYGFRVRPRR